MNRIYRTLRDNEPMILILIFLAIECFFILDYVFWNRVRKYGSLVTLCFMPVACLFYWGLRSKSRLFFISFALGVFVMIIYFFLFWVCYKHAEKCVSSHFYLSKNNENYLSYQLILLLSVLYGVICAFSCLFGLRIKKEDSVDEGFSQVTKSLVFVSVAVAIYLFLLERILSLTRDPSEQIIEYDPFLMSFISIAIAISSLYVIFGYFSQDGKGEPIPVVFLISAGLSFSIGSTFSVSVLEFVKRAESLGALPTHWVFLCIWTLFVAGAISAISRDISGLSGWIKKKVSRGNQGEKMGKDESSEALRSLFTSNQEIHLSVMEETAKYKMDRIHITIEHFNNWLEMILDQKQYTEEEMENSLSAVFLFYLGEELRWIIYSLLSGAYFDVLRTLRFVFESILRTHFLDKWLDEEIVEMGMAGKGASIEMKSEILSLFDKIKDISAERSFMEGRSHDTTEKVIEEHFAQAPQTEDNRQLKIAYEKIIPKYRKQFGSFGGKDGLISQLPGDIFTKSEKNELNKLYASLSKYSHLSNYVLDSLLDIPSSIFTPSFNDKLFDGCIQLLTSVMDIFIAISLLHFERLRVTNWLSRSVRELQMPLSQKVIERRGNAISRSEGE